MELPYRIERTGNRTSSATFESDGVLIRLAGRLSAREEERHIASLLRRMARRYAAHRASTAIDPFGPLIGAYGDFRLAFSDGNARAFVIAEGKRTSARMEGETWIVRRCPGTGSRAFRAFLWRLLGISERPRIEALVRDINAQTFRTRVTSVRLRHMLSRFGSCASGGPPRARLASGGRITLNTALLFVPENLRTYVIIHELAHIPHPNHSRAFWNAVGQCVPEYEECRRGLKQYRLCDD